MVVPRDGNSVTVLLPVDVELLNALAIGASWGVGMSVFVQL